MTATQKHTHIAVGLFLLLVALTAPTFQANAQYFGRNKVSYRSFDFKVVESPHFELYHYFESDSAVNSLLRASEKWYQMHQEVLSDTIRFKNPLIFYQNHADFQQTTAISGSIGVGTGGVTEGLKNRVVMPAFESNAQTDHVLGHELVHAFQYNLLRDSRDSSLSLNNMRNLPLWMVEGMAEYMSLGRVDAHTAMWMRDAYLNKDIPSIKDLNTNPKYFPYRYGQAFWAFVTGVWGDKVILPLYLNTARYGLDAAVDTVLKVNTESLSNMWKSSIEQHYAKIQPDTTKARAGKVLLSKQNAGEMNISPAISPDGRYVMFLSEIGVFTMDLFLADAQTGRVIRKVSSTARNSHIDAFSYVESAGAWAPDSRRFAFVAFSKGRNNLIVVDANRGRTLQEHFIPGVPAFSNPSWSPDGRSVVVTGLVNGQSDLYLYNLDSKEVRQLTNDPYSDLQPNFSADGNTIIFSSDRLAMEAGGFNGGNTFNLTLLNMENGELQVLDFFRGANNLNPVLVPDARSVYFLSNRDGFRNLYTFDFESGEISQLTRYMTGISGITEYSPAISVSQRTGELVYSYFSKSHYSVYKAKPGDFESAPVEADAVDFTAATLPPFSPVGPVIVGTNLAMPQRFGYVPQAAIEERPYRPQFKLDYVGNTGVGVSASQFGTGVAGGVAGIFSDILGNNQLFGALSVNGEIYDFGGQFAFLNQKRRLHWGASVSHIPYRTGYLESYLDRETIAGVDTTVYVQQLNLIRIFEEKVSAFAYLPFSSTRRFEIGGSLAYYSYRNDEFNSYYLYDANTQTVFPRVVGQDREKGDAPDGFPLQQLEAAYVGDNSFFGVVGPLQGHRFRIGAQTYFGRLNYQSLTIDLRKYFYFKPFNLSFRALHYARYGSDAESFSLVGPLYLGYPGLVHGYDDLVYDQQTAAPGQGLSVNDLIGSRMLVGNIELRLPFTGPEQVSLIKSRFLLSELAFFFDSGLAWDSSFDKIDINREELGPEAQQLPNQGLVRIPQRVPVFSTGIGLRVNVFGQLIVEPYVAKAFQRNGGGLHFGVNFVPGW
jgi:Tol biopolymer transport system component